MHPRQPHNLSFSLVRRIAEATGFKEKAIPLPMVENLIGRQQNFPVSINDVSLAQHHASIIIEKDQAFLQ